MVSEGPIHTVELVYRAWFLWNPSFLTNFHALRLDSADAPPATNSFAPSCNTDVNCAQYAYCYIVWWKFTDTIGPASQLRLEQNDDFYDVDATFVSGDVTGVEFFQELLFHHFNDANEIVRLGTVTTGNTAEFLSDRIFLNSTYWDTTI